MTDGAVYALETRGLSREFGGFFAVNGVNFRLARNSMHAVIGPNGAGKTTLFNLLTKYPSAVGRHHPARRP